MFTDKTNMLKTNNQIRPMLLSFIYIYIISPNNGSLHYSYYILRLILVYIILI